MRDHPLEAVLYFGGGIAPPPRRPGERLRWARDGMGREVWEQMEEGEARGSEHAPARASLDADERGTDEEADAWVGHA